MCCKATAALALALLIPASDVPAKNWPGWRGDGSGISPETKLPLRWGADENVLWKVELTGEGTSSPVVWDDRVLVTSAFDQGTRRAVLCL